MGEQSEGAPPLDPVIEARIKKMAADFMPQVRAEAWKVYQRAPHALDLDEMQALGLLGLAQATAKWADYCWRRGFDPDSTEYFIAYVLRRVKGAMLDALRSQDWVTRSSRTKAKMLRDAGQDLGLDEETLARRAGLTVQEVRETIAAVSARPVSLDAELHDVASADGTESRAVVGSVLAEFMKVVTARSPETRALVALRYYYGCSVPEIAEILELSEDEVTRMHQEVILACHSAMVRAVT